GHSYRLPLTNLQEVRSQKNMWDLLVSCPSVQNPRSCHPAPEAHQAHEDHQGSIFLVFLASLVVVVLWRPVPQNPGWSAKRNCHLSRGRSKAWAALNSITAKPNALS